MHASEPRLSPARWRYDIGKLVLIALICVPVYLLLNQLWQSIVRLIALYALLTLFCLRLGEYMHRAMRRLPAEIPPWHGAPTVATVPPWMDQRFGAAEAIRSARRDPHYVQAVLKPRLRRLLIYRLSGTPELALEEVDDLPLARVDPTLLDFLRRQEPVGIWARFRYRRRRSDDVLNALRRLEAL
jgi:hypothetical protein